MYPAKWQFWYIFRSMDISHRKQWAPKRYLATAGPILMQMRLGFLCPGGLGTRNNREVRGLLAGMMDGRSEPSIHRATERASGKGVGKGHRKHGKLTSATCIVYITGCTWRCCCSSGIIGVCAWCALAGPSSHIARCTTRSLTARRSPSAARSLPLLRACR